MISPIRLNFTIALKEVLHLQEARDLTSVVTEKETAHRDENAHNERPPREERNRRVDDITGTILLFICRDVGVCIEVLRTLFEDFIEHSASEYS